MVEYELRHLLNCIVSTDELMHWIGASRQHGERRKTRIVKRKFSYDL